MPPLRRALEKSIPAGIRLGAFMVPGLALWLPSGYSWGAAWLLLLALLTWPQWRRARVAASTWALAAAMCGMACYFLAETGLQDGAALDRPAKYIAALPCLFMLAWRGPSVAALWNGMVAGAWGAGGIALWQTFVQRLPRATGYTNAIQYGDLSLLLGLLCLLGLAALWQTWPRWQRASLAGGAFMGLLASLLSQTRGGWLALALLLPVLAALMTRHLPARALKASAAALLAGLAALALTLQTPLLERMETAAQETQQFMETEQADTSVGHRFAHWQMAWRMGLQKPLWGWGRAGYEREKQALVERGQAPPSVLRFSHAHNEVLDAFVRRGLAGALAVLAFYAVPLAVFWPTRARHQAVPAAARRRAFPLRLAGVALVMAYMGFGLTQVFFSHNSGNLFYLFMLALLHGALLELARTSNQVQSNGCQWRMQRALPA